MRTPPIILKIQSFSQMAPPTKKKGNFRKAANTVENKKATEEEVADIKEIKVE